MKPKAEDFVLECVVKSILLGFNFNEGKAIFRTMAWMMDNLDFKDHSDWADKIDAVKVSHYFEEQLKQINKECAN